MVNKIDLVSPHLTYACNSVSQVLKHTSPLKPHIVITCWFSSSSWTFTSPLHLFFNTHCKCYFSLKCTLLPQAVIFSPSIVSFAHLSNTTTLYRIRVYKFVSPQNQGVSTSHLQSFPAYGFFLMSQFFASGGQSIGASASASVLPMNIQD